MPLTADPYEVESFPEELANETPPTAELALQMRSRASNPST